MDEDHGRRADRLPKKPLIYNTMAASLFIGGTIVYSAETFGLTLPQTYVFGVDAPNKIHQRLCKFVLLPNSIWCDERKRG